MSEPNTEIPPVAEHAAEEVPVPPTDPPHEEHHEETRPGWASEMVSEIVGAINTLKEASPITPPQEEVLDKSPVKPPWTHRRLFGNKE